MKRNPITPCHCGSGKPLEHCCLPLIEGVGAADSAESLMRSRYSAYVMRRHDYIQASWHPSTRPADGTHDDEAAIKWLGLTVHEHSQGLREATVRFTARYKISGRMQRIDELSRFVHEDGRWWYVDGRIEG